MAAIENLVDTLNHKRTSLDRKRWQLSRVIFQRRLRRRIAPRILGPSVPAQPQRLPPAGAADVRRILESSTGRPTAAAHSTAVTALAADACGAGGRAVARRIGSTERRAGQRNGADANCGGGARNFSLIGAGGAPSRKRSWSNEVCRLEMETKLDSAGGGNKESDAG